MTTLIQRSFSAGELSPSLYSRVDHVRYQAGLRTCRNFLIKRSGGVDNRPGTKFVLEAAKSSTAVRLIPFVFNDSQTYVLEFGDLYMRVAKNGSMVYGNATITSAGGSITSIASVGGTTIVTTASAHGMANGSEVILTGAACTSLSGGAPPGGNINTFNNRQFRVANVTSTTFEIKTMVNVSIDSSAYLISGGGTYFPIFKLTSPYAAADLANLRFSQSADVITIVHPSYAPRTLSRLADNSWAFATITFAPAIGAPNSVAVDATASPPLLSTWVVTAVQAETFDESLASSEASCDSLPSASTPRTITWAAVVGADHYNVYKKINGIFGFIGTAGSASFVDNGITPDVSQPPVTFNRNPFGSTGNYPSCTSYIQQRRAYAGTNNHPESVYLSKTGLFNNFNAGNPVQDDDAVTFTLAGKEVNLVQHLLQLNRPILFSSSGEWSLEGDSSGTITPTAINPKQESYDGCSALAPITIGSTALFVQARGTIVRDLGFEFQIDGYRGNDLTTFSNHLFDSFTLVDWTYQKIPNSIVWAVRSDGTLLSLTYIREQQILGWARHDFDGTCENVCAVPEGNEDALYVIVNRTIDSHPVRYIERMATRQISTIEEAVFEDAAATYDGRAETLFSPAADADLFYITNGTTWDYNDTITLILVNPSLALFDLPYFDQGEEIHLTGPDGEKIRFQITLVVDAYTVQGRFTTLVPVSMRNQMIADWSIAKVIIDDLFHLEGKEVSVFADGFVVANPNNSSYNVLTVQNGMITLPRAHSVIHVGLPITADLETLDIDTSQGETIADKKKLVQKVTVEVVSSRGLFVGAEAPLDDSLDGLTEVKLRNKEGYNDPVDLKTENIDVNIRPEWNSNGRVFIRQSDPLPLTVQAITPAGLYPFRGGG